jgi:Tfp pilus assembly protein PilN
MSPINLVPSAVLEARAVRSRLRHWLTRLGLIVALLAPLQFGLAHLAAGRQAEVRVLTGRYALLQQRLAGAQSLIQERDSLATRRSVVEQMRGAEPASEYLEILGRALTPDSYLTLLSLERCDPRAANPADTGEGPREAQRSTLRLRGRAPGNRQVGEILRRLADEKGLREVTLVSVSDPGVLQGPPEVEFEIVCVMAGEP